jgi:23S rRNA (pseudouridine1915-N3)-methyltransferase
MIDLSIITVGTLKESYLKEAVSEYKKRLSQYAKVDEINIKEEAIHNEDDRSEIERALSAEGEKILAAIPKSSAVIALCVEGKQLSSEDLAEKFREMKDTFGRITLIIGSSYGLCDKVKSRADLKLSVSKLTFPHQLMRPLLMEIVYRSMTILAGKRYHK